MTNSSEEERSNILAAGNNNKKLKFLFDQSHVTHRHQSAICINIYTGFRKVKVKMQLCGTDHTSP